MLPLFNGSFVFIQRYASGNGQAYVFSTSQGMSGSTDAIDDTA